MACFSLSIEQLRDIILTLTAVTGAYVAFQGLRTWEQQLKGSVEYNLARRILKLTYRLRNAIKQTRHPMMLSSEMSLPPDDKAQTMSQAQVSYYGISKAYQVRWEKVSNVIEELNADLLEAEALWGNEAKNIFDELYKLINELNMVIYYHLKAMNPDDTEDNRRAWSNIYRKKRDILYDTLEQGGDQYSKDFSEAIIQIENYLKPHLRK